jgi:hypothetical protein
LFLNCLASIAANLSNQNNQQMKSVFNPADTVELTNRINQLSPTARPLWGKMDAAKMLAHINTTYAYVYEPEKFKKPNFLIRFILRNMVKKYVLSSKPYTKNGKTNPEFIIKEERNFEAEKEKLVENIMKTQKLGESYFEGLENRSFGRMTAMEWNTMYYKHLDHHLSQFGV